MGTHASISMFFLMFLSLTTQASVVNGEFSDALSEWTAADNVSVDTAGHAVLGDSGADSRALYQGVALAPGKYQLSFDFNGNGLSPSGPSFLDVFSASLYFTNNLGSFDPLDPSTFAASPDPGLFDLDSSGKTFWEAGPDNITSNGPNTPPSPWEHFNFLFDQTYAYAIPFFELFNVGNVPGDSTVLLDNVSIQPASAPEPAPILLLATVLLPLAATRWRRTRLKCCPLPPVG